MLDYDWIKQSYIFLSIVNRDYTGSKFRVHACPPRLYLPAGRQAGRDRRGSMVICWTINPDFIGKPWTRQPVTVNLFKATISIAGNFFDINNVYIYHICYSGSKFRGPWFKPALVRHKLCFNRVPLDTTLRDSMKRTAQPGLGQGLENNEHKPAWR